MQCPHCKGKGSVWETDYYDEGIVEEDLVRCDACDGKGSVPDVIRESGTRSPSAGEQVLAVVIGGPVVAIAIAGAIMFAPIWIPFAIADLMMSGNKDKK